MPSLKLIAADGTGATYFPLSGGECIGRDLNVAISLPSTRVSRRHCEILLDRGDVYVSDLGSANGTFVNEERIDGKRKLVQGDVIAIGDMRLEFSSKDAPPGSGPTQLAHKKKISQGTTETRAAAVVTDDASPRSVVLSETPSKEEHSVDATSIFKQPGEQLVILQRRLDLVFSVSQALGAVSNSNELLAKIVEQLFNVFPQAGRAYVLVGASVEDLMPAVVKVRCDKAKEKDKLDPNAPITISRTVARRVFQEKHAILSSDARNDFGQARSLAALQVTSFLAAPLVFREEVLGLIQVETREIKRRFTRDDLNLLAALAGLAGSFLKNTSLLEGIAREVREREALQSELRLASRIQSALLPKRDPEVPGFSVTGRMRTAKEVGGDLYDFIETSSGAVVAIGDVSGKGVPAGLVMVMARSILRSLATARGMDVKTAAIEANRILKQDLKPGVFMSLLLARLDGATGELELAGCGHERPIVYRAETKKVERLALGGCVLGVVPDNTKHVASAKLVLAPGDQVVLYTDGVTEATNTKGEQFKIDRLEKTIARHGHIAPAKLLDAIESELFFHSGSADQHDDETLIAIRRA